MTGLEVKDWEKNIALKGHCPQIPKAQLSPALLELPRAPLPPPPLSHCLHPPPLPQVDGLKARLSSIVSVVAVPSLLPPSFGGGTAAVAAPPPLLLPWTTALSSAALPQQARASEPPAAAEAEISGAIARALGEVQAMVRGRGISRERQGWFRGRGGERCTQARHGGREGAAAGPDGGEAL